jgi:hypothetical protein
MRTDIFAGARTLVSTCLPVHLMEIVTCYFGSEVLNTKFGTKVINERKFFLDEVYEFLIQL